MNHPLRLPPWPRPWLRLALPLALAGAMTITVAPAAAPPSPPPPSPEFSRDILPILESRCLECHGPDKQKADLRLDHRTTTLKGGESGPALIPGRSVDSLLFQRISAASADEVMPPKGDRLTAGQIELLRAWIDQGALWPSNAADPGDEAARHWSFQPVRRPPVPQVPTPERPFPAGSSPIDAFIAARLALDGLSLSPEAPRPTLIRRLYLVMLGLPPTPAEVDRFVSDPEPRAFERLVDRVLADERYGERWARHWLDVVRFAESNGFETNRERPNAWRFRDYVIDALNRDLPYNRFLREQIAGDSLGADVATGFLVAGPVDIVGSPDPVLTAQQRADELDDMVNTTGTAVLGLTLGCARCHTHKFDPIEHREYYSFAAIFAGVRHGERPLPPAPDRAAEIARLNATISELEQRLARFVPIALPLDPDNPAGVRPEFLRPPVNPRHNLEALRPVDARFLRFTILASSSGEPCLDELEVWSGDRNVALSSSGTRATASGTLPGYDIHKLEHINDGQTGNRRSWISHENGRGWVQLEFPRPVRIDRIVWSRDRPGEFGDRIPTRYRIEAALESGAWQVVAGSADRQPPGQDASQSTGIPGAPYQFKGHPEADARQGRDWLAALETARREQQSLTGKTMAYAGTFSTPTPLHRLHRGDPMQKREPAAPATLALFRPVTMAADEPEAQRRLRLAEWLADDANPLTPRVLVNRLWQHHFGVGLVDTPNDFGRNGSRPTHPELLDWLASELVSQGWSIKTLQRQILLSATWRQSSTPRRAALRVDAASRLLWRFPPRRLEAEAIRDGILHVSGALDARRGGPSFHLHEVDRENVYHYHPKDAFGPSDFRRMVYAYKVRMEQDGIFGAFDCPDGSLVVPRRTVSTTALQALNLYNSGFVLQQSELLVERLRRETGADPADQVRRAWQLAFNRNPTQDETRDALALARDHGLTAVGRAVFNANEFLFIP